MYQHQFWDGSHCALSPGKVVCVGRNYAEHVAELNNDMPEEPLLFMKGNNALTEFDGFVDIPEGALCHNEIELAFLISKPLSKCTSQEALRAVAGVGLALDLTLRDKQSELKAKGLPWERAKAFDGSCPVSKFVSVSALELSNNMQFSLQVNQTLRQQGDSRQMIWPWQELIAHISSQFSLYPGDIVLTGTPKGVGPLNAGDQLQGKFVGYLECAATVRSIK